jgi:hypothetical protein
MYNPAQYLSLDTRTELRKLGISLDDYVANILAKTRMRDGNLANQIVYELQERDQT